MNYNITQEEELIYEFYKECKDLKLRSLINQYIYFTKKSIVEYKKLMNFNPLSKNELTETSGFIKYNKQHNEFYVKGIEFIDIDDFILNEEYKIYIKNYSDKLKKYWNRKDELLDVYYNSYLNMINRHEKLNQLGI